MSRRPGKDSRMTSSQPAAIAPPGTSDESATATLLESLAARCAAEGFDLFAATTLGHYEQHAPPSHRLRIDFPADACLVLVGNSRTAWSRFLDGLETNPALRDHPHPFDTWTIDRLSSALAPAFEHRFDLRFAFEGPPHHFSALHLAESSGLAARGPAGLAVHPELGPWFALRAALTLDLPWHPAPPPPAPCSGCSAPCVPALERALANSSGASHPVHDRWQPWVAVRDACPVGRAFRYPDAQIRWHYAHDRAALHRGPA